MYICSNPPTSEIDINTASIFKQIYLFIESSEPNSEQRNDMYDTSSYENFMEGLMKIVSGDFRHCFIYDYSSNDQDPIKPPNDNWEEATTDLLANLKRTQILEQKVEFTNIKNYQKLVIYTVFPLLDMYGSKALLLLRMLMSQILRRAERIPTIRPQRPGPQEIYHPITTFLSRSHQKRRRKSAPRERI